MSEPKTKLATFEQLCHTIKALRNPTTGCPWDLKQTHESLKSYLIEESYELLDAIDRQQLQAIQEELGDVLLQVLLHSQIAADANNFSIDQVIGSLNAKLIARHPHVFGDAHAQTAEDVQVQWQASKEKEASYDGLLSGIPKALPALQRAQAIGERVAKVGFDWSQPNEVVAKVAEEVQEFIEAEHDTSNKNALQEEFGDILFSLVQLARKLDVNAEDALQSTNKKFIARFQYIEDHCSIRDGTVPKEELEALWQKAKRDRM